jgi:hypothetical protein
MSLLNPRDSKDKKKGNKNTPVNKNQGSKFIGKPGKAGRFFPKTT